MNIYSNASPNEIRDEIGWDENLDLESLSSAVMVLCLRISELQTEIEKLKQEPSA